MDNNNFGRDQFIINHPTGKISIAEFNAPREITVSGVGGTPPSFDRYWVDRTSYQTQLKHLIATTPVTEIVAEGGFGKSSLAAWGYENLRGGFQKRVWVSFGQPKTFDRVARWILQEIGFPNKDPQVNEETLLSELLYRLKDPNTPVKTLVILDQLESVAEASDRQWFEQFLRQWAEEGKVSRVLVTTRSQVLSQEPIALVGFDREEGATFLGREELTGDRFSELIGLTGGHPLLLKLAASWTRETYESQVDDRAIDFFTKLFANYKGDPKAGVSAIFDMIFEALPIALQELLCRLSVYRLPFDEAMAITMQPQIKSLQEETLKNFNIDLRNTFLEATKTALQALCNRGLLLSQDDRFVLHPLVAGLVRSRVTEEVRRDGHEKAIGYFRVNFRENRIDGNLESCRAELEVFNHTCEIRDYEEAFSTYCEISEFLRDWNFSQEHINLLELLIEQWGRQEDNLDKIGFCLGNLSYPYRNLGNYQKAIDYSFQCLEVMQSINNQYGISVALTHLGSVYSSIGDHQKEIEFHSQSLDIDRAIGNRNGEGGSLCNIGIAYASLDKYEQAIDFFQQALPIQREVGNREFEANSLNGLGNAYKSLGNYQKAIDFHIQSLEVNKSINNKSGIASSLGNLGSVYRVMGNHQEEIDLYSQSLEIEQAIGLRIGVASSLGSLGTAHRSLGNHQKAIDFHFQSLELYQEIGHQNDIAICLICLGNTYCDMGDHQKAIDFYCQSLETCQSLGTRGNVALSVGDAHYLLDNYQESIKFYSQSLEISQTIRDNRVRAKALGGLGLVSQSLGEYNKAIEYHSQTLEIKQAIGDRDGEGGSLCNLGNAFYSKGEYEEAIKLYEKALVVQREVGNHEFESNSLTGLGAVFSALGQYQRSIDFHQQALDICRNIGNQSKIASSLANLGNAYGFSQQYPQAVRCYEQHLEVMKEIGDRNGEASSSWILNNIYQQRGRLKRSMQYRHQAYRIWQDINLLLADAPFPAWTKKLYQSMGDNWAEQLIASETSMA